MVWDYNLILFMNSYREIFDGLLQEDCFVKGQVEYVVGQIWWNNERITKTVGLEALMIHFSSRQYLSPTQRLCLRGVENHVFRIISSGITLNVVLSILCLFGNSVSRLILCLQRNFAQANLELIWASHWTLKFNFIYFSFFFSVWIQDRNFTLA